jgi:hypothetical protein
MGRRPGRSLATLLAAGAVSNLGDGVTLAAPLLAAPFAVDAASFGISALLLAAIPGRFRAAALAAIPDGPGPARVRPCGPTSPPAGRHRRGGPPAACS